MTCSPNEKLLLLQQALEERFPEVPLQVDTANYGNMLRVTFETQGKRYALVSPGDEDWRQHDVRWWLHRAGHHIQEKLA